MATKYTYFLLIISTTALMFLLIHVHGDATSVAFSQNVKSADFPIADYDIETGKEKGKARKDKDSHFKGLGNPDQRKPIAELPLGSEPLPTSSHWWIGLSALPVEQSDIIVLGHILGREAHLSDDRTGIYSEFTVQIEEVFRDTTRTPQVLGSLSVNRAGGSVRFASGKIQKYEIAGQGMPGAGSQYVLFLRKSAAGDLLILTGYEFVGGNVTPLDGEDVSDPRSNLPFAKYRGADQKTFLKDLHEAAAKSIGGGAE